MPARPESSPSGCHRRRVRRHGKPAHCRPSLPARSSRRCAPSHPEAERAARESAAQRGQRRPGVPAARARVHRQLGQAAAERERGVGGQVARGRQQPAPRPPRGRRRRARAWRQQRRRAGRGCQVRLAAACMRSWSRADTRDRARTLACRQLLRGRPARVWPRWGDSLHGASVRGRTWGVADRRHSPGAHTRGHGARVWRPQLPDAAGRRLAGRGMLARERVKGPLRRPRPGTHRQVCRPADECPWPCAWLPAGARAREFAAPRFSRELGTDPARPPRRRLCALSGRTSRASGPLLAAARACAARTLPARARRNVAAAVRAGLGGGPPGRGPQAPAAALARGPRAEGCAGRPPGAPPGRRPAAVACGGGSSGWRARGARREAPAGQRRLQGRLAATQGHPARAEPSCAEFCNEGLLAGAGRPVARQSSKQPLTRGYVRYAAVGSSAASAHPVAASAAPVRSGLRGPWAAPPRCMAMRPACVCCSAIYRDDIPTLERGCPECLLSLSCQLMPCKCS